MLRNPGGAYDFNGERRTYPDIRLIYWAGGNPYHHHQDLNALHEAWQGPETIIVNEPWWTATAKRADIVFPATTPYEREDIGRSNLDDYLFHMPRLIPPVGEARDDYEIFAGLAERLGVGRPLPRGSARMTGSRGSTPTTVRSPRRPGSRCPISTPCERGIG
jgi:biotin/methionine sulfoxide reductase